MRTHPVGHAIERNLRERKWLFTAIFVCAVVVQIVFLLLLPNSAQTNDSKDFFDYYSPVAQHVLTGKGLTDSSGDFASVYPPAYPLFLAGSFALADWLGANRVHCVICLNILLMGLSCLLVFWTAEMIFNAHVALLSSVLWITYIFNLWLIKQPNTDVLFMPLFYGGVYCLISAIERRTAWMALVSGLLLGAAALVRPIALLLTFLLAGAILLNRTIVIKQRLIFAAVLAGAFCMSVLPWEGEVYVHTGQVVPLCTNGPATMLDGLTFASRTRNEGLPEPVAQWMKRTRNQHQNLRTTGTIIRYVLAELTRDPKVVLELFGVKIARSWFGTDSRSFEHPILLVQLFYLTLGGLGLFASRQRFRNQEFYLALFIVLVCYFWGMASITVSILRYMVPVMAYLLIFGAVAVDAYFFSRRRIGKPHLAEVAQVDGDWA